MTTYVITVSDPSGTYDMAAPMKTTDKRRAYELKELHEGMGDVVTIEEIDANGNDVH